METDYVYRVVKRAKGSDDPWVLVDTQKRIYFKKRTANSALGYKRNEHEHRKEHCERFGYDFVEQEFVVERSPVNWEPLDD